MSQPRCERPLRIVVIHNRYRSSWPSGETVVVDQETDLLRSAGHEITRYDRSNDEIPELSLSQKALLPIRVLWSGEDRRKISELIARSRPDVVHLHNTFPLISPSVLAACREAGVPVVATLHNYRLMCANAQLLRDGRPCELCVGRVPWRAVAYRCYHNSAAASVPVAAGIALHGVLRTWLSGVRRFIAPAEFVKQRFVAGGLPEDRIIVKPNFVRHPQYRRTDRGGYTMFLGRLSAEKGVDVLIDAWSAELGKLLIVGSGAERPALERRARRHGDSVVFLGGQPHDTSMRLLAGARTLVAPARWYETFGLVVAEAFAHGVPVVASAIGVFPELVQSGRTGLLFASGDVGDLRRCLLAMADPVFAGRMGKEAHRVYETKYTPERSLAALLSIYAEASDGSVSSNGGAIRD